METKKKSLFVNALVYGLILGAVYIVLSLIYYVFDVNVFKISTSILMIVINIALLIIIMLLGTNAYRDKALGGKISYLTSLLTCAIIGFIAFIVSGIYSYIFYRYFEPQLLAQMHMRLIEMYQNMPNLSDSQLEKITQKMDKGFTPAGMFISTLKMAVIGSVVIGAVVALFVKREKEGIETSMEEPQ
jgi:hypothetical protein